MASASCYTILVKAILLTKVALVQRPRCVAIFGVNANFIVLFFKLITGPEEYLKICNEFSKEDINQLLGKAYQRVMELAATAEQASGLSD